MHRHGAGGSCFGHQRRMAVQVVHEGKQVNQPDRLGVQGATTATVYLSAATNFVNYKDVSGNASRRAAAYLKTALKQPYPKALEAHSKAYQTQFNRVKLDLPATIASLAPTNQRVADFNRVDDRNLMALLYQYGRYLFICSSQPGGQPANLQGIWCRSLHAPWDSKYTININTEMNYWPAEVTNLSECHEPLFSMLEDLSVTGTRRPALFMVPRVGWLTTTPTFGVLPVRSMAQPGGCGPTAAHGFANISGSTTSIRATKRSCVSTIR